MTIATYVRRIVSAEERFAPFEPRFKSGTMHLDFGQTDVLKVAKAVNLLIGWDVSKDAVRGRSCLGFIDLFGRGKRRAFRAEFFDAGGAFRIELREH